MTEKKPRITGMPNGRPRKDVSPEVLIDLYNKSNNNWIIVAEKLGMSKSSIYRKLQENNIKRVVYYTTDSVVANNNF